MADRDRLIELLKPHVSGTACLCESGSCELTSCRDCKARRLSDYLLANGVIVPPCKVGDTVYFLERHPERFGGTKINTAEVVRIKLTVSHKGISIWLFVTYRDINGNDTCGEVLYGRSAFLTKEEAEEKLKELGK